MKVCILGPVNSDKYFGGVGTFTESLADGMLSLGLQSLILTDYSSKERTYLGSDIRSYSANPKRKSIALLLFLRRTLLDVKPDYIISSLEYGLVIPLVRKRLKKCIIINFLHGFPPNSYPRSQRFLINQSMRIIGKKCDFVLSNSTITALVNGEIFGIPTSGIVNLGVGFEFLNLIKERRRVLTKKSKTILFAGRLIEEKGIDRIFQGIDGLTLNEKAGLVVNVVGEGPDLYRLKEIAKRLSIDTRFLGFKNAKELIDIYIENEIFISLNPHEPFGITYLEALSANCKVVCPNTGGQKDFTTNFAHSVYYVNPYSVKSITDGLRRGLSRAIKDNVADNYPLVEKEYNFKRVAEEILSQGE